MLLGLVLCIPAIFASTAYASDVQSVKTFSVNGWSQGAVLTKNYYVYTDWSGNSFKVIRCDRSDGGNCKSSATFSGKPSSMYHKWGTDYAQAILKKSSGMYCIKLSTMEKSSGCGSMLSSSGLSANGDIDGARQGWTKYGNYYMRGYGNNGGMQNYIWVFNSSKNIVKKWAIPLSGGEVEDVMVDGDTGQVWFTWYGSSRHITYYKVAQSVFSEYFNPSSQSSSSSSDSGSSSSIVPPSKKEPYNPSQSTYDGSVATTYFGNLQDDDEGCGVFTVLNFIIDILTFGIAIAAAIGIGLAGTTYLTAKGNVAQATKAKRRLYEIIIGLAVYAVLYVGLNFLLPGGNWSINKTCEAASSSSRAVTGNQNQKTKRLYQTTKNSNSTANKSGNSASSSATDQNGTTANGKKLLKAAEALAAKMEKNGFQYGDGGNTWAKMSKKKRANCGEFVIVAMKEVGLLPERTWFYFTDYGASLKGHDERVSDIKKKNKLTKLSKATKVSTLVKNKKLVPGDIVGDGTYKHHTMMYAGKSGSKYKFYSVGGRGALKKNTILNFKVSGSHKIRQIIHPL